MPVTCSLLLQSCEKYDTGRVTTEMPGTVIVMPVTNTLTEAGCEHTYRYVVNTLTGMS